MINYRGKRLRIHTANGQRFGFGYLPHWVHNKDTSTPRQLIVWCGPVIATWNIGKKGWKPRAWNDPERYNELVKAEQQLYSDILQIETSHNMPDFDEIAQGLLNILLGPAPTADEQLTDEERWAAESEAVRSRARAKDNGQKGIVHCGICGEGVTLNDEGTFDHNIDEEWTRSHDAAPCFWNHADVDAER